MILMISKMMTSSVPWTLHSNSCVCNPTYQIPTWSSIDTATDNDPDDNEDDDVQLGEENEADNDDVFVDATLDDVEHLNDLLLPSAPIFKGPDDDNIITDKMINQL